MQINEKLQAGLDRFFQETEKYRSGQTSADHFRAFRVPFGVYEQRTAGRHMLRIRITAGDFSSEQLRAMAQAAVKDGNSLIHVTTRQDLQVHDVPVENLHRALVTLAESGLSTIGGGGNSVRNVTACADTGFCDKECFGVADHARAVTTDLLETPFALDLPRKYKLSFSGCDEDCAGARANDVGYIAKVVDGKRGFAVYAGGGMGGKSRVSALLEDFVPEDEIFYVAEAVKRVFDRLGNRRNKHQARLRFLVEQLTFEGFKEKYNEALTEVRLASPLQIAQSEAPQVSAPSEPAPVVDAQAFKEWQRLHVTAQPQPGLNRVEIPLFLGTILGPIAERLADMADRCGAGKLRSTLAQNLAVPWVPTAALPLAFHLLSEAGLATPMPRLISEMSVCAGASTCRLGICQSRGMAQELRNLLEVSSLDLDLLKDLKIFVSGCPNSCGRHLMADVGLSGGARRIAGEVAPHYEVRLGSRSTKDSLTFAEGKTVIPARAVPETLVSLLEEYAAASGELQFHQFASTLGERFLEGQLGLARERYESDAADVHLDWGTEIPFSLAGRSPGECGAGVFDLIEIDLAAADEYLTEGALYRATVSASRALLVTQGIGTSDDREALRAFAERFIEPNHIDASFRAVVEQAIGASYAGDPGAAYGVAAETVGDLVAAVRNLYGRLDQSLRLPDPSEKKSSPASGQTPGTVPKATPEAAVASDKEVDFRGVVCPLNYVKTRMVLDKMVPGEILSVLLDDAGARNVPESVAKDGHEVQDVTQLDDHWRVLIIRH
jgi:sulfite reductase (ferredoxin)